MAQARPTRNRVNRPVRCRPTACTSRYGEIGCRTEARLAGCGKGLRSTTKTRHPRAWRPSWRRTLICNMSTIFCTGCGSARRRDPVGTRISQSGTDRAGLTAGGLARDPLLSSAEPHPGSMASPRRADRREQERRSCEGGHRVVIRPWDHTPAPHALLMTTSRCSVDRREHFS